MFKKIFSFSVLSCLLFSEIDVDIQLPQDGQNWELISAKDFELEGFQQKVRIYGIKNIDQSLESETLRIFSCHCDKDESRIEKLKKDLSLYFPNSQIELNKIHENKNIFNCCVKTADCQIHALGRILKKDEGSLIVLFLSKDEISFSDSFDQRVDYLANLD
jgi:hypothetical protein